ncbi:N-acetylmuramoyl-L-alanine amidase [Thermobrachium celere]|uniref:N-acetylmuramoyl-L-alanine amidase n=1 Tax=Thermobrachium celere DSM 8682 TaxID=941824 RepID=R7RPI1_9CLOT|nr:N-acetylmuramoyl-L-alanine amidase [Thermobrachium celere]CDF57228.1 N-acetylmuramoyl-L-alanine amidase [Thermobrachium celere DSM 8682]
MKIMGVPLRNLVLNSILVLDLDIFNLPFEVLKALITLKRSELIVHVKNSGFYKKEYSGSINTDKFDELDSDKKSILNRAYDETEGIVVINNSEPVALFFTKCCCGGTANSEAILGYKINYLRKVLCKRCSQRCEEIKVDCSKIAETLGCKINYKEQIREMIKDVSRDDTGRIRKLNLLGKEITGDKLVEILNLKSNRVYFKEDSIVFKVLGEGLGLGICIEGACSMAGENKDFKDIIEYYYTGVEFIKLDEYKIINTLEGRKIVIDAGHGGRDLGHVNGDFVEKDLNLNIALKLCELLKLKGAECILTREKDEDVTLSDRVKLINKRRPDIFISIHQNGFPQESVNGIEVYCFKDDKDALNLANKILKRISEDVKIKNRGCRDGDYFILRESKSTGIVVECLYITGNVDSKLINDDNLDKIAEAMFKGICEYFEVSI